MGKIRERLRRVPWMNNDEQRSDQLDFAGEAIESEFKALAKHIEALKEIDLESFREWLESLKIKKPVPTDKDRPFRVRDIIELFGGGLRIVLKVKSEREMELLDVFTGNRWWSSCPSNYTLVYRPGSPKPEPMVKEKIDTDRFGEPEGGLKPGDIISTTESGRGKDYGIFCRAEKNEVSAYWQHGNQKFDRFASWINKSEATFEFRPRFPDRKER